MATHVTEPLAQEERWSNRSAPEPHVPIDLSPTRIFLFLCKVAITYRAVGLVWDYARRSGLSATIHQPVAAYLRSNSAGLPTCPYGTDVIIPEGPAKGFVIDEAITGPKRG